MRHLVTAGGHCASSDIDVRFSLGFYVNDDDASLSDIIPDSPADRTGLSPGDRLIAVDGRRWAPEELRDALAATARGASTITLLYERVMRSAARRCPTPAAHEIRTSSGSPARPIY